jgi:hypothetical protein
MHLIDTITDTATIADNPLISMFVTIPQAWIDEAERLEIWGSDFTEGDADCCEYRLIKDDSTIWKEKVSGY